MEVIDTTDVSPEDCFSFLFSRGGLGGLIGPNACACFLVARPLSSPMLLEQLIRNIATIDSTTGKHIAFVVFYGKSTAHFRSNVYGRPQQLVARNVSGVSRLDPAGIRFDENCAALLRESPERINRSLFEQSMTRTAEALMERFRLCASDLPCLLFVDPVPPSNHLVVRVSAESAIDSIYVEVLSPLADAFRDMRGWAHRFSELRRAEQLRNKSLAAEEHLRAANERDLESQAAIGTVREEQKRSAPSQGADIGSCNDSALLGLSEGQRARLRRVVEESTSLEIAMQALAEEIDGESSTGARELAMKRLEKQKRKNAQAVKSLLAESSAARLARRHRSAWAELDSLRAKNQMDRFQGALDGFATQVDAARQEFAEYTRASRALGYEWEMVYGRWPELERENSWQTSGPRAFGVVEWVLGRSAKSRASKDEEARALAQVGDIPSVPPLDRQHLQSVVARLRRDQVRIFLSYRRSDSQDVTGRIYDRLLVHLPREQVFKDVDSIPLGVPFPDWLMQNLSKADVLLAVIGPHWLSAVDDHGALRLHDPADYVRREIETAMQLGLLVIPLLVANASMAPAGRLPEGLAPFTFLNGQSLRPDPDFHRDMDRLLVRIGESRGWRPVG